MVTMTRAAGAAAVALFVAVCAAGPAHALPGDETAGETTVIVAASAPEPVVDPPWPVDPETEDEVVVVDVGTPPTIPEPAQRLCQPVCVGVTGCRVACALR